MTIVETRVQARAITGGVDTHADVHVAAALDPVGGLLGVQEFPATPAGYARLLGWLGGFGTVCLVGIEGTGSYGAGLARHITAAGVRVVEAGRANRQDRRRQGKSDPLDAVSAARAAQSGRARGAPKGRDGAVEAIRALMVAKRTARSERIQTINQARALVLTGPDDIRIRCAKHAADALVAELAALRPRPGSMIRYHTLLSLRELGRRAQFLGQQRGILVAAQAADAGRRVRTGARSSSQGEPQDAHGALPKRLHAVRPRARAHRTARSRIRPRWDSIARALSAAPQRVHGDVHGANLLTDGQNVTGIIDVDHLPLAPRGYDLGYYMVLAVHWRLDGSNQPSQPVDEATPFITRHLLTGYDAVSRLTRQENDDLPALALFAALGLIDFFVREHDLVEERWLRTAHWIGGNFDALRLPASAFGV